MRLPRRTLVLVGAPPQDAPPRLSLRTAVASARPAVPAAGPAPRTYD